MAEKSNTLMAQPNTEFCRYKNARIRRLTPTECARLQTIPEWYEFKRNDKKTPGEPASDSAIYKALGNGWTVRVIEHFFQFLPQEWRNAEPMNKEWK